MQIFISILKKETMMFKNSKYLLSLVISTLLIGNGTASAALVTESNSQNQTLDGQYFNFSLNTNNHKLNTSSMLTVSVQGDFDSGRFSNESINFFIEGIDYGKFSHNSAEAYNVMQAGGGNFNAYKYSLDFSLDSALTNLFLADNILNVVVDFGSSVNEQYGWWTQTNGERSGTSPFAAVSYTYENTTSVPEPTSLTLLGLGALGFAASRRKTKV